MTSHVSSLRTYAFTFAALMVLLAATVGVAFIPLGEWNAVVAVTVATMKMVLILLFFMHLYDSDKLMWIFAMSGFAWLLLLLLSVVADVLMREQMIPPGV